MSDHPPPDAQVTSLMSVLSKHITSNRMTQPAAEALRDDLLAREDNIKEVLLLGGAQFGAMSGFVAEVVALSGLGTPPDTATRAMIHDNFHTTLDTLRRDHPEWFA